MRGVYALAAGLWATSVGAQSGHFPEVLSASFEILDQKGMPRRVDIDYLTPPGALYDVGTHKLHLFCAGRGRPTVVLEAGLGGFSLEWLTVMQQLAGERRVCAYDRAGYGWSEYGPPPRTTEILVTELNTLLERAGEPGPYLLAGHSFGGYVVQAFARRWPDQVTGVVLVDSSHPEQDRYLPAAPRPKRPRIPGARVKSVARPVMPPGYPNAVRNVAYYLMGTRKASRTQREELRMMAESGREVLRAGPVPASLDVTVLSRSFALGDPEGRSGHSPREDLELTWQALQSNLGHLYHAERVDARFSGHFVHLDQPWLVTEAISGVIDRNCFANVCLTAAQSASVAHGGGAAERRR